jgi:RNA polymerase sigma-70 factor (ECF subfamily)
VTAACGFGASGFDAGDPGDARPPEEAVRQLVCSRPAMSPLDLDVDSAPDAELVRRVSAGGEGARRDEAELCRRFAPRARLYGRRHLRDADQARDLVQAVLVVLIEAVRGARIEDPERVDRFVLGTCRNVTARMRDGDRRAVLVDPVDLEVAAAMPTLERLDAQALYRCATALDARSRTIVNMSFHDEASADEIAALLGTTAGNVRVLRHRAIAQLRTCLDGRREVAA